MVTITHHPRRDLQVDSWAGPQANKKNLEYGPVRPWSLAGPALAARLINFSGRENSVYSKFLTIFSENSSDFFVQTACIFINIANWLTNFNNKNS